MPGRDAIYHALRNDLSKKRHPLPAAELLQIPCYRAHAASDERQAQSLGEPLHEQRVQIRFRGAQSVVHVQNRQWNCAPFQQRMEQKNRIRAPGNGHAKAGPSGDHVITGDRVLDSVEHWNQL